MKKFLITTTVTAIAAIYLFAQTKKPVTHAKPPVVNIVQASVDRGKVVYKKVCLSCHMADGGGVPHLNPPLAEASYIAGDKKKLIWIVLKGMTDRIPIDDEYYSNNMAPHTDLNDQQIADVLTYVRHSFGNKASEVTPAEVRAVRIPPVKKK